PLCKDGRGARFDSPARPPKQKSPFEPIPTLFSWSWNLRNASPRADCFTTWFVGGPEALIYKALFDTVHRLIDHRTVNGNDATCFITTGDAAICVDRSGVPVSF